MLYAICAIIADPFLHPWDERFHALVAKNLMSNPIVPMLRANPIVDSYDKFLWCCNHVWLHKQPLFMWQIALSMKIFGVSEWSMRLPSALMGTLMVLIIYRIVKLLKFNNRTALFTALLLACSNFHLKMIAGIQGMDHNDVAHSFYVLLSIWCLLEYYASSKKYWIILIGIFAGAAILNKWLTGLLVYLIWGLYLLQQIIKGNKNWRDWLMMAVSLVVCCMVFVPWQVYILQSFPDLAAHEYEFNRRHITEALEGHEGSIWYYIDALPLLFGRFLYWLIPVGCFLYWKEYNKSSQFTLFILIGFIFVFSFFSFVVQTKVTTYLFFVVPFAMLLIAIAVDKIISKCGTFVNAKILTLVSSIVLGLLFGKSIRYTTIFIVSK